ncbi:hypothetical protein G6F31_015920 [Rhizopus arrhizus]|nr:hypothetical protein G6F31_015920 [Rhizopus arrhizus]
MLTEQISSIDPRATNQRPVLTRDFARHAPVSTSLRSAHVFAGIFAPRAVRATGREDDAITQLHQARGLTVSCREAAREIGGSPGIDVGMRELKAHRSVPYCP